MLGCQTLRTKAFQTWTQVSRRLILACRTKGRQVHWWSLALGVVPPWGGGLLLG